MKVMNQFILAISSGFGLGYSPFASGTVGTLLALPLAIGFSALAEKPWLQVIIALVLSALAIPICDAAEKIYGTKDDGRIVADEYLTFPIVVIGLPILQDLRNGLYCEAFIFLGAAFIISRILDIIKPSPARQSQRLPGGIGIVVDDFISNIYSWILIWALKDCLCDLAMRLSAYLQ